MGGGGGGGGHWHWIFENIAMDYLTSLGKYQYRILYCEKTKIGLFRWTSHGGTPSLIRPDLVTV